MNTMYRARRGPVGADAQELPIEKGVPLPPVIVFVKYPFARMGVGESFFMPCAVEERKDVRAKVQGASCRWRAKHCPRKAHEFTTRQVDGGVRCWRTK